MAVIMVAGMCADSNPIMGELRNREWLELGATPELQKPIPGDSLLLARPHLLKLLQLLDTGPQLENTISNHVHLEAIWDSDHSPMPSIDLWQHKIVSKLLGRPFLQCSYYFSISKLNKGHFVQVSIDGGNETLVAGAWTFVCELQALWSVSAYEDIVDRGWKVIQHGMCVCALVCMHTEYITYLIKLSTIKLS